MNYNKTCSYALLCLFQRQGSTIRRICITWASAVLVLKILFLGLYQCRCLPLSVVVIMGMIPLSSGNTMTTWAVVASLSEVRDRFQSSAKFMLNICFNCIEKTEIYRKKTGNGPFFKKKLDDDDSSNVKSLNCFSVFLVFVSL